MNKKNSAHQLVIDSLTEALLQLLENKKMDSITVSELCEKAGVSRISFYRNYDDIGDILKDYLSCDLAQWWTDQNAHEKTKRNPPDFWGELFTHLLKHKRIIRLVYRSNASFIIKGIIFDACGPLKEMPDEEAYARAMLAGTIFGYTDEWIRRGMKDYPKYLSMENLLSIIENTLSEKQ